MNEAPPWDREAALALLDFHLAAGADAVLDELPHDRFAESARRTAADASSELPRPAPPPTPQPVRDPPPASPPLDEHRAVPAAPPLSAEAAAADARSRAATARDLRELEALVSAFDGCTLKVTARQLVFADGVPGSRVMVLGEAPGAEEDRTGKPFVGRAGHLLNLMLAAIGLDRTSTYIANIVPWRPPGNRTPTPQEVATCLPFALRQIELARPEILVTLGAPATQAVLGTTAGITRSRGRWSTCRIGGHDLRVLPILHPAFLLRQPIQKRLAWRDLRAVRAALDGPEPGRTDPV